MKNRLDRFIGLAMAAALTLISGRRTTAEETQGTETPAPRYKASTDPADAAACRESLQKIHDAITAFGAAHERLPHWLSELSPEYLDANLLVCPYVKKIADLRSWRYGIRDDVFQDPNESTSYAYEFCHKEIVLWTGVKKTWNEYKQRQVERMGAAGKDAVPIVRCFAHDPILNLACSGRIYPSGTEWESSYEPQFQHEDLHPEPLFFHHAPRTDGKSFPRRDPALGPRSLDLSAHYNAYLDETWLPFPRDCDLKQLSRGLKELGGARFDVRGLIQLNGDRLLAPYPIVVPDIKVGQSCAKIHFLHATRQVPVGAPSIEDGRKLASYVVCYRSGAQIEIPVRYGHDVKDWFYDPVSPNHGQTQVVWEGENLASKDRHLKVRLFLTTWQNPWPEQPIDSLSLVSAMAETAPFVVAITLE
jgi:hypothetical protein